MEVDSTAALRYFVPPPPDANLRSGLEEFLNLPLEDRAFQRARRLDNVFTLCLHSENAEELLKAEVVTWRGILRKYPSFLVSNKDTDCGDYLRIMFGEALDLNISYNRGVLYLEEESIFGAFE